MTVQTLLEDEISKATHELTQDLAYQLFFGGKRPPGVELNLCALEDEEDGDDL